MTTGYVYALIDPRDNTPRYVGQTIGSLEKRLYQHIKNPSSHSMRAWLCGLLDSGLQPEIVLLETTPLDMLNECEYRWITHMLDGGALLLNARDVKTPRTAKVHAPKRNRKIVISVPGHVAEQARVLAEKENRSIGNMLLVLAERAIRRRESR